MGPKSPTQFSYKYLIIKYLNRNIYEFSLYPSIQKGL
jgi:hypothetical protein